MIEQVFGDMYPSEAQLRNMIDTIPALAWCCLPDGANEFTNKRWLEYAGLSPDESLGGGWQAAVHPEDLGKLIETGPSESSQSTRGGRSSMNQGYEARMATVRRLQKAHQPQRFDLTRLVIRSTPLRKGVAHV